jgi:hypothetical protein
VYELFQILLIIHFLALIVGATGAVAMPIVMARMGGASPEGRQMLAGIGARIGLNSRVAVGVLVLSGIAMVAVKYGGVEGMNGWFWTKMALLVVLLAALILGVVTKPGTLNPRIMGWITRLSLLGIIVSAVLAFT